MTATVIMIVFSLWTAVLAVLGERDKTQRIAYRLDLITSLAGVGLVLGGTVATVIMTASMPTENAVAWASSAVKTYYIAALSVFGLLFVLCAVTSLLSRANTKLKGGLPHKLRVIMIAVSGAFVFALGYIAYIATNDTFPMDIMLILTNTGLGCMMRLCSLIENKKGTEENEK